MIEPAQIRAARALLGWRQEDLSKASGVGTATIWRIEKANSGTTGYVSLHSREFKQHSKPQVFFSSTTTEPPASAFGWLRGSGGGEPAEVSEAKLSPGFQ